MKIGKGFKQTSASCINSMYREIFMMINDKISQDLWHEIHDDVWNKVLNVTFIFKKIKIK